MPWIYKERWGEYVSLLLHIHDHETRAAGGIFLSSVSHSSKVRIQRAHRNISASRKGMGPLDPPQMWLASEVTGNLVGTVSLILSGLGQRWTAIEAEVNYCPFWVKTLGRDWRDGSMAKRACCIILRPRVPILDQCNKAASLLCHFSSQGIWSPFWAPHIHGDTQPHTCVQRVSPRDGHT